MARPLGQERAAIEEEGRNLPERRQRLEEKEREAAIQAVEKTGLLKLDGKRWGGHVARIRTLGIEEVEKRLKA